MKKNLKTNVILLSPEGKVLAPIQIVYDDKNVADDPSSAGILFFDGSEYKGFGTDPLWTDTLADLEVKLPENVRLACCMTCRHGNMCPYGNVENQLFCTKNIRISGKEDMCRLFDQTDPFEERSVASLGFCDDFIRQSDDYYTYNDYLFRLNGKKSKL